MITVTPSNTTYLTCLKKFDTLAVRKQYPYKAENGTLRFSNGLHDALRRIYDPSMGPPDVGRLPIYVRAGFLRQPYSDEDVRAADIERAEKIVRAYLVLDDDKTYTTGVEVSGIFPIRAGDIMYNISARIDRVLIRPYKPTELVIRDYKGGQRLCLEPEAVFINLAVAKCLNPGFESYVLELDGIGNMENGVDRVVYRSKDCKGLVHLLSDKVRRYLDATEYPAEPGEACMHCPLLGITCQKVDAISSHELDFAS